MSPLLKFFRSNGAEWTGGCLVQHIKLLVVERNVYFFDTKFHVTCTSFTHGKTVAAI